MIKPQRAFWGASSAFPHGFHKSHKLSKEKKYLLNHLFLGVFGLTMVAACASSEQGSKVSELSSATIGNPAVAQSTAQFSHPNNLPFLELKPATQRQKDILSQMPDSDYRAIPKELIRVAEVDLNNDGIAEFIATYEPPTLDYCGNRGCPMAIYSNQGGSWRIIYGVLGYDGIKIDNSMTNGFKDLLIPVNSNNRIFRVLTFRNSEYNLTHFQDGNNRFSTINRREVYLPKSPVFYSQPSTSFPVSVFFSSEEPIVLEAKTNDWYLIRPCTSYACSGTFVYIPVEVVDGRNPTTNQGGTLSSSDQTNGSRSETQVSHGNPLAQPSCNAVVADIRQDMTRRLGLNIKFEGSRPIEGKNNPFPDRNVELGFGMQYNEPAFSRLMDNVELYTKRITDACISVARVSFGEAHTDGGISIYRMPDGSVREAVIIHGPPLRNTPYPNLPWGHEYCCP